MKKKFLTFFDDIGTSGSWKYIYANSTKDILKKYPRLTIVHREPDWFTDEIRRTITTDDIDDPPGIFLRRMRGPLPTVHLELYLRVRHAAELRQLITEFGKLEGFAFGSVGPYPVNVYGHKKPMFMMVLARPDMDIEVNNRQEENRYKIEICNADDSPAFEAVTAKFRELLESRWPGRVRQLAED